jgi:hypothetical protein
MLLDYDNVLRETAWRKAEVRDQIKLTKLILSYCGLVKFETQHQGSPSITYSSQIPASQTAIPKHAKYIQSKKRIN